MYSAAAALHNAPIVLLYEGVSRYRVLNVFAHDWARAFRDLGCEAYVYNFELPVQLDEFQAHLDTGRVVGNVFINGLWYDNLLTATGQHLMHSKGIPCLSWYVDPPVTYQMDRLVQHHPQDIVALADEHWLDTYRQTMAQPCHVSAFIQHGALPHGPRVPLEKRAHDVVFFGSYPGPLKGLWEEVVTQLHQLPFPDKPLGELVDAVISLWSDCPEQVQTLDFTHTFLALFNEQVGLDRLASPQAFQQLCRFMQMLDRFLRALRREMIVRSVRSVRLTLVGRNWRELETDQTNLHILPPMDFEDNLALLAQSRIAISNNILVAGSAHPRVAYAMAQGTPVVTETNRWITQHLEPGVACEVFETREPLDMTLDVQLVQLLADSTRLQAMQQEGERVFEAKLHWRHMAQQALELFKIPRTASTPSLLVGASA